MPKPTRPLAPVNFDPPSPAQIKYLYILLDDCGYYTAPLRRTFIQSRFNKQFADELSGFEISRAIGELKQTKDRKTGAANPPNPLPTDD